MKKKLHLILAIVLAAALLLAACNTSEENGSEATDNKVSPVVNPLPETVSSDRTTVRLYFGYLDKKLLVGETSSISVPVNESTESAIVKALITGPSATRVDFVPVINPETEVVQIKDDGTVLTITLSSDFTKNFGAMASEERDYTQTRRYLAVYSIANSLIEQGKYSRVRILIDEDGSGNGRPITRAEAGMEGTAGTEPFERNGEIELNAANTMREILNATKERDWETLYGFIAYKNAYDQDKPSLEDFTNEVVSSKLSISDTAVLDDVLLPDTHTSVVMANYALKLGEDEARIMGNIPIRLTQENDVWKITYNTFKANFLT